MLELVIKSSEILYNKKRMPLCTYKGNYDFHTTNTNIWDNTIFNQTILQKYLFVHRTVVTFINDNGIGIAYCINLWCFETGNNKHKKKTIIPVCLLLIIQFVMYNNNKKKIWYYYRELLITGNNKYSKYTNTQCNSTNTHYIKRIK